MPAWRSALTPRATPSGALGDVAARAMGSWEVLSVMPAQPGGLVAVEDGDVLAQGDLAHGLVELGQVGVVGAAVDVVELDPRDLELGAQLDEGEDLALRRGHAFGRPGDLGDPAEVGRRVGPPVRAGEVDQLAGGQVGGEARLGLVVDDVPAGVGDRGQFAVEVVHRSAPFRLPMPSEPEWLAGGCASVGVLVADLGDRARTRTGTCGAGCRGRRRAGAAIRGPWRRAPSRRPGCGPGSAARLSSEVALTRWSYQSIASSSSHSDVMARW